MLTDSSLFARPRWGVALSATALAAVTACGGGSQAGGGGDDTAEGGTQRLSIATGGTSGVYYVYGGGLANVLSENVEGVSATAEATSASVDNMLLIGQGDSDLAFVLADTATDAVNGEASFEEAIPAQALASLYTNYTQVVATEGSGITDIESLRGKRVSIGAPGSGTEVIALRILEAAGLDPQTDIEPVGLSVAESVAGVRDGTIDAFFWSGGLPTAGITDLATSDDIVMVPTAEYVDELQEQYGEAYQEFTIPADVYSGVETETQVIGVPNLLVVNEDMSEDTAYEITKALFEQKTALEQVHPEAANLDPEAAQDTGEVELHPGAERYYDEVG